MHLNTRWVYQIGTKLVATGHWGDPKLWVINGQDEYQQNNFISICFDIGIVIIEDICVQTPFT